VILGYKRGDLRSGAGRGRGTTNMSSKGGRRVERNLCVGELFPIIQRDLAISRKTRLPLRRKRQKEI
jgi:hypothetical protein